jgi:restriction system protein
MPIPDYQTVMLPLLKVTSDGEEHQFHEAANTLASSFKLTEEERREPLPSGGRIFDNRVGWARTYLKKAGLLSYPRRAHFKITARGQSVLNQKLTKIDVKFLRQFPEFVEFQAPKTGSHEEASAEHHEEATETPEELLASGYLRLRKQLESELLARAKSCSPEFFEKLVVRLLTTMGYGGSLADAGKRSANLVMEGLTVSSRKISLVSIFSSFRPRNGMIRQ